MKKRLKCAVLSFCIFVLFGGVNLASADTTPEIEAIFNWAETDFPEFFSAPQTTQMIGEWTFRHYPSSPAGNVYAGVKNGEVFVLGGPWGTEAPTFIDTVVNLTNQLTSSGGDGSVSACDGSSEIPAGMVITQNGNVVNITTNGQCIVIPLEANNFCETPAQPEPTGISVLTTVNVTSSKATGIEIDQPGAIDPFGSIADGFSSTSCTINALSEDLIINSNVCFDMTDQLASFSNFPGVTINPPITFAMVSTTTGQVVADCFATNAQSITDAFTGETWIKDTISGGFTKVGS